MNYAILYKVEKLNSKENARVLFPEKVISGDFTIEEKPYELSEEEKKKYSLPLDNCYYLGNMCSENMLTSYYGTNKEKAKEQLFLDVKEKVYIHIYDSMTKKIDFIELKKDALDIIKQLQINTTELERKQSKEMYSDILNEKGTDFTILTENDIELLNTIADEETKKAVISYLIYDKENYGIKITKMKQKSCLFFEDSLMYQMLNSDISIGDELNEKVGFAEEKVQEFESEALASFIVYLDSVYEGIMAIDDLQALKTFLDDNLNGYIDDAQAAINALDDNVISKITFLIDISKKYLAGLLKLNDVEQIKDVYDELYMIQTRIISILSDEELDFSEELEEDGKFDIIKTSRKQNEEYKFDYNEVKEKMISRIIGRDNQIDRMLTTIARNDRLKNLSKRNAMIIAGTTGTGKTQTFVELKKALSDIRPVNICDTNQLTAEGYVGGTIEQNILTSLILDAHSIHVRKNKSLTGITDADIELAKHGIVILDEIDKRAGSDKEGVNKADVINQLLKLMDPETKYMVEINHRMIEFDTSNLTIFASGAFQEYFDSLSEEPKLLGFNSKVDKKEDGFEKYEEVNPESLIKYGLDRQYIGRYNRVTLFPPHTKESLIELEKNKKTSNLQVEIDEYEQLGIKFMWEEGFIEKAAEKAFAMKTGGRALNNIISRSLGNLNSEVNNRLGEFKIIFVPIEALEDSGKIVLIDKNDKIVFLKNLYLETEEKNKKIKSANTITQDEDNYNKVLTLINKNL